MQNVRKFDVVLNLKVGHWRYPMQFQFAITH